MFLRVHTVLLSLVVLFAVVKAFTADEVEIFQLQKSLEDKYGPEMNLYKFLKLPNLKKSTSKEITKNLRRLSKKYHPDKNPKYKTLYARLNLATQILANDEKRKTYDYYWKNGFPDYDFQKGGFFFTRFKPQTWFLAAFVYVAVSVIHYYILKLQYTSNRRRIDSFILDCKQYDDTNGLGTKRLTFQRGPEEPTKQLLLKLGEVYLIEEDGTEELVSPDTIPLPTVYDSFFFKFPKWVMRKIHRTKDAADTKVDTKLKKN
ncbi:Erj5p KNAG_0D02880 [Huiozyma naganishii CBS 8797]|uniref:J domain-containing protein n=1 Tax=Huiozyma naganishii (strain ATCC MYA-139 / BCRC 22969 / CBS 8797 / KCTC 17520 / NBRC 10181 / NCYC 3082 / Yp74L-3) TaxID=1071383 RepID=J7RY43_HUIN7|nr:hypothetical protein KNAG_0D02880 [Kazachstania naganishii CBS 8797]CCK70037.1 hypothetical protein KNAG_0D02880 [Kazachstania naganishii CBS 8797]